MKISKSWIPLDWGIFFILKKETALQMNMLLHPYIIHIITQTANKVNKITNKRNNKWCRNSAKRKKSIISLVIHFGIVNPTLGICFISFKQPNLRKVRPKNFDNRLYFTVLVVLAQIDIVSNVETDTPSMVMYFNEWNGWNVMWYRAGNGAQTIELFITKLLELKMSNFILYGST